MLERQLRLWSGLVIAAYVIPHLINHGFGIVSFGAMETIREWYGPVWRTLPGTVLFAGAFLTHFVLTLVALYRRRHLAMPPWEGVQLVLGLLIVPVAANHVVGTQVYLQMIGTAVSYETIVASLWIEGAGMISLYFAFILVVWVHLAVGLHFWLRVRARYLRWVPVLYPIAVLIPVLAVIGLLRAMMSAEQSLQDPAWVERVLGPAAGAPDLIGRLELARDVTLWIFMGAVGLTFGARRVREAAERRRGTFHVALPGGKVLSSALGPTVLEVMRAARIPHAAVCGGRGRCTTCRVSVTQGFDQLEPAGETESKALKRIRAGPEVRLACQIRPHADVTVVPLLPATVTAREANRPGGVRGREQDVVIMFVDLRGSTKLGEERLPYDVLFILNQFFAEMAAALTETGGHYAQFSGDGLMALYGIEGDLASASRQALVGARVMFDRLEQLNRRLGDELREPLRMGVGIHCGPAIVGTMGPPNAPNFSAIGDNVNVAARLEALTKATACAAIVSASVAEASGLDFANLEVEDAEVRGRDEPIAIYRIGEPAGIPQA